MMMMAKTMICDDDEDGGNDDGDADTDDDVDGLQLAIPLIPTVLGRGWPRGPRCAAPAAPLRIASNKSCSRK